jgi:agmatine deiminase
VVSEGQASLAKVHAFPLVVVSNATPPWVLRGDFEPPNLLLLAYSRDWPDTLWAIVEASRGQTQVGLLINNNDAEHLAASGFAEFAHVTVLPSGFDSPWVRDYGPLETYDRSDSTHWLDYAYTWDRPRDDRLPRWLSRIMRTPVETSEYILDGGAVISNGNGLCALTATSLVEGGFSPRATSELQPFLAGLGCHVTAILPTVPRERTGHVDMIAQFLSEDRLMLATVDPKLAPELAANLDLAAVQLRAAAQMADQALDIIRIPIFVQDDRFYSYINATRLRTRMLIPHFSRPPYPLEKQVMGALTSALPELELISIDADKLIMHGGAVHCATLGLGSPHKRLLVRRSPRGVKKKRG